VLRFVDPPFSAFMAARQLEAWVAGDTEFRIALRLARPGRMSPNLPLALVAAEDQNFAAPRLRLQGHREGARTTTSAASACAAAAPSASRWPRTCSCGRGSGDALAAQGPGGLVHGADRSAVAEARILEVYANVAEFGDGIYGAQAAARSFFRKDAAQADARRSARLAAVLPSPKRYSAAKPGPYVQRRTRCDRAADARQIGGTAYLEAAGLSAGAGAVRWHPIAMNQRIVDPTIA
jgi:monofunctional biosynthetic peptidoglycan transglycosylase